jgi:hypothetical protein
MKRKKLADLSLDEAAVLAMRDAFRGVVLEHRRLGLPLHFWQDGKVVAVAPDKVRLPRATKLLR